MIVSLKETEKRKTQGCREECDVNIEAGVEVLHPQTKECQGSTIFYHQKLGEK